MNRPQAAVGEERRQTVGWATLPSKVQHRVCHLLSIFTLNTFAMTSKDNYRLLMDNTRARIRALLARFHLEEEETLETMRDCKAIISGSAVLDVLEGSEETTFTPSDLDIYVPMNTYSILRDFVTIVAGYVPAHVHQNVREIDPSELNYGARSGTGERSSRPRSRRRLISQGIRHIRYFVNPRTRKMINIVITALGSPTSAVLMFHSTLVMNFITWNTVVSAYPAFTARRVGIISTARTRETTGTTNAIQKYEERGYDIKRTAADVAPGHECGTIPGCSLSIRRIDDEHAMWIGFYGCIEERRDVIDVNLTWRLARTQRDCYSIEWESIPGWVAVEDGVLGEYNTQRAGRYEKTDSVR